MSRTKTSRWYQTPAERRHRVPIKLTLPAECHGLLVDLAADLDVSRSRVVERAIEAFALTLTEKAGKTDG